MTRLEDGVVASGTAPGPSGAVSPLRRRRRLSLGPESGLLVVIIAITVGTELKTPVMLEQANVIEVLRATVVYFVAACAETLIIVGGGLDLSVGAVVAAGGCITCALLNLGVPWEVAIVLGLGAGGVMGALNALLIIRVKIPPFVATLGMFFAVIGVLDVATQGNPVIGNWTGFDEFGQGSILGIPYLVLYGVIVGIVFESVVGFTRFGYNVKALGGNRTAALENGVRVDRVATATYIIGGSCAALAGILLAAREGGADPAAGGAVFTFQVFAAVVIGGTSMFGGLGSIRGTAVGSLLFSVLNNAMALDDVNPLWLNTVTGVVLIAAVAFDQDRRRRQFRAQLR